MLYIYLDLFYSVLLASRFHVFNYFVKIILKNLDFIIFSSIDWPTHWQIHHQLATSLALNGNRVLFVENTGVRSINTGDFNRIKDRVVSWKNSMRGYKDVSNRIVVYSPLLLPFPYSKVALFFNKILFKKSLLSWIDSANFNNPIVISFLPTPVVQYVIKAINPSLLVYYCANDFSKSSISAKGISPYEDRFIFEADMVFVISHSLMDKVKKISSNNVYYFPPGIDFHKFHQALALDDTIPNDIGNIKTPIIGYIGALSKALDQDLLCALADHFPEYTIAIVGPKFVDISKLEKASNIVLLGSKQHKEIPYYIKEFDVAIIPYICNEFMDGVYPSKLFEYLSMGKPVVSTNIREVSYISNSHRDVVIVSKDSSDFINAVELSMHDNNKLLKDVRVQFAQDNSWNVRFNNISKVINKRLISKESTHIGYNWKGKFDLYLSRKKKFKKIFLTTIFVLILSLYSPLFWLMGEQLILRDTPNKTDAIVVFSGDGEVNYRNSSYQRRALDAVKFYNSGYGKDIFISSGREQAISDVEIIKLFLTSKGIPKSSIHVLNKYPSSTYQNVQMVKHMLDDNNINSILFITAPYHSLRAVLTWRKSAPNIEIITPEVIDTPSDRLKWGISVKNMKVVVYEYTALVYNLFKGRI